MVKRKAAAKKAAKPKAAKKTTKAKAPKVWKSDRAKAAKSAKGRKPKGPQQLELVKGARYTDLDRLCVSLGENRDEQNRLVGEENDLKRQALKSMRQHGSESYNWAGVQLARVPGDEKLTVRKSKAGATATGDVGSASAGEGGEGQDAGKIAESLTDGGDGDDGDPETSGDNA